MCAFMLGRVLCCRLPKRETNPHGRTGREVWENEKGWLTYHVARFSALFLLHIIFIWTTIVSWMLFAGDIGLIGYLAYGAWRYAETLDRVEVPIFGPLASSFVDDE